MTKKKKTRRGGKARHPMQIQDAKMMSKNEDEKKVYAHIKSFKCGSTGHFASKCPTIDTKCDALCLTHSKPESVASIGFPGAS